MNLPEDQFARRMQTMQIIVSALIGSVVTFGGVCVFMVHNNGPQGQAPAPGDWPIISAVALAMLVTNVPLCFFIPTMLLRGSVQRIAAGTWTPPGNVGAAHFDTDDAKLLAGRQTAMIISFALLESAGFMGCLAYLLEGQTFALTTAVVAVVFMLFQFPTRDRTRAWLEQHLELVAELRRLGGPSGSY